MHSDRKGDMGFGEAMLAMIVVSIVLSLYLVFAASMAVSSNDPLEGFDPDSLDAEIEGEISVSESYLFNFLGSADVSGVKVTVTVPHFIGEGKEFLVGSPTEMVYSETYLRILEYDDGRSIPVILEVNVYR